MDCCPSDIFHQYPLLWGELHWCWSAVDLVEEVRSVALQYLTIVMRLQADTTSIVGVSNQLSWIAIGISSLRFRAAIKLQNKEHLLPFKNWTYPWGPWFAVILNSFLVLVQGWSCFSPVFSVVSFFSFYVELPIMLVMFVGWKLLKRTKLVKLDEMDLETDTYTLEDLEPTADKPGWRSRVYNLWRWIL